MKSNKLALVVMALAVVFLSLSPALPGGASIALAQNSPDPAAVINSPYASTPPALDGSLNFGEWDMGVQIPLAHGFVSVRNDNNRLYVLLDATGETTLDNNDYFWLTFDKNQNGAIDPNVDMNYGTMPTTANIRYQYYLGPASWTGVNPTTYSARARGFGCFWADGSFILTGLHPLHISCSRHRVWELAIDLNEIGAHAGGSVKMGVRVAATSPAYTDEVPSSFDTSFANLTTVNLAPPPFLSILPLAGAIPAFEANPIEITQAIQTRTNAEPLVANKTTVARVYTRTANVRIPETVSTFLYGSTNPANPIDLPGSPLLVQKTAPISINRLNLNDTANFILPSSWNTGSVTFQAKARDLLAHTATSASQTLGYTASRTLTIWVVPVNTGSVASPVLPPQSEIDRQESYLRTVYPVANVTFVQKPWTVLGVVSGEPITALNTYYNSVALGYILTCIFTGTCPPYALPDQVYGMVPSGGGLSDPVWVGGEGIVARGFQGTSLEGTMAHEINHNLDKDSSGTWGHHTPFGCGASGPDPSWPYANSNINEVGFDTRLPWSTSSSQLTVIPSTIPDLMSYCQSGKLPTKWISPYRWENLLNHATKAASLAEINQINMAPSVIPAPVYYISGKVFTDFKSVGGKLDPVWLQTPPLGLLPTSNPKGNYAVRLIGGGKVLNEFRFLANFLEDPEEAVTEVYFNIKLPQSDTPVNLIQLVDLSKEAVLDSIQVSDAGLKLSVVGPAAGETWSGQQKLAWNVSNNPAGDTFNILFSNDGGASWEPYATGIAGADALEIDTTALPNTKTAMFKVIGTDGFNTSEDNSGVFAIDNTNTPPSVSISSPAADMTRIPSNDVTLEGSGSDPTDGLLADDHLLWYEGNTLLGNGQQLTVHLPAGVHTLTLQGVDSAGLTASSQITILVGMPNLIYLPLSTR